MSNEEPLRVWYDGDCGLCQRSRAWCEARVAPSRVRFIDFRAAPDDRLPVSRPELESSMWVETSGGDLVEGFDGWRRLMIAVPRWRWLARLSGAAPLRWLGPPVYRCLARVRHRLPLLRTHEPRA